MLRSATASVLRSATRCNAVRVVSPRIAPISQRQLHATPTRANNHGLVNLFEAGENPLLSIHKLTDKGFVLSDGLIIPGGCIFAEGRAFLWDVDPPKGDGSGSLLAAWDGWTKERFEVFERLVPRPEMLIFGTGQRVIPPPPAIRDYISSLGITMEVMDSRNAASTYNLLSEEGRTVSAALCPLKPVDMRTGKAR